MNVPHDYNEFSRDKWKKIADFALLALSVDEMYGGLSEDYLTSAICLEALGYACEDNGFIFAINNHLWAIHCSIIRCIVPIFEPSTKYKPRPSRLKGGVLFTYNVFSY